MLEIIIIINVFLYDSKKSHFYNYPNYIHTRPFLIASEANGPDPAAITYQKEVQEKRRMAFTYKQSINANIYLCAEYPHHTEAVWRSFYAKIDVRYICMLYVCMYTSVVCLLLHNPVEGGEPITIYCPTFRTFLLRWKFDRTHFRDSSFLFNSSVQPVARGSHVI